MALTHSRRALVSVTYHHYRLLLSGDHLHHGLLGEFALKQSNADEDRAADQRVRIGETGGSQSRSYRSISPAH
jgi:hypothetical protein